MLILRILPLFLALIFGLFFSFADNFTETEIQKLLVYVLEKGEINLDGTIKKSRLRAILRAKIAAGSMCVMNPEYLGQLLNEHKYLENVEKELGVYKLKLDKISVKLEEKGEIRKRPKNTAINLQFFSLLFFFCREN